MKKMRTGVVAFCLAFVALVFACKGEGAIKTMQLGEAFALAIDESARLAADDLRVTFKAVNNDSRCPQGAQCVTAGEADVVLTIKVAETVQDVTVKVGADAANRVTLEPYVIRILKLEPYPVLDQTIPDRDRQLELRVDRTGG